MTILKLHSESLQDTWLDHYGHLNEAFYLLPFTNATWKFQDHFAIGVDYFKQTGCALYTVETHLRYIQEVRAPAMLEIETMVLGSADKKIWFSHSMIVDGELRATGEFMLLHFDTLHKRTTALPDAVQENLQQATVDQQPDWIGRRINLAGKR